MSESRREAGKINSVVDKNCRRNLIQSFAVPFLKNYNSFDQGGSYKLLIMLWQIIF
jgi:hypothetical protein